MAKDDKKEKPPGWNLDLIEALIVLLFFLALAGSLIPAILNYVTSGQVSFFGFKISFISRFFVNNVQFFKSLGFLIGGVAAVGTFVFTKWSQAVWRAEKAKVYPADIKVANGNGLTLNPTKKKWEQVLEHAESESPSEWRMAIIEADIILDDLLEVLRLPGETMGDKLKAVEKSDFNTIDLAWEAHKARNMIAHEGSDFLLNQHETRRIISLYEAVFKEFHLI